MAGLLSDDDILQFREAIKSVTDTFCVLPVVYERHGDSLDTFNEDREDEAVTSYNLNALVVYSSLSGDMANRMPVGAENLPDGYALFNLEDLQAAGLMDGNYLPLMNPAQDFMVISGARKLVIGTPVLGQFDQLNTVLKVFFTGVMPTS
jgi:hypothetical protein